MRSAIHYIRTVIFVIRPLNFVTLELKRESGEKELHGIESLPRIHGQEK